MATLPIPHSPGRRLRFYVGALIAGAGLCLLLARLIARLAAWLAP
ncbi:MAG: hypothetical protein N3C59_09500 [Azovibrio sp.]|nr:hypothetical protein [Azovibrio sp.]